MSLAKSTSHPRLIIVRHLWCTGAPAGFESILSKGAWSRDDGGKRVAVGGADRTVTIWDVESGRVMYKVRCSLQCSHLACIEASKKLNSV